MTGTPLSEGSISLRLYPHVGLSAEETVRELRHQAVLATEAGFDGVMTSEHHGGFAGYMPNPLQVAGWLLEAMPTGWAAPCPLLVTLRPPALVTEEVAWLAARFPGRVGLGLAAGSLDADFDIVGLTKDDLARRFSDVLAEVAGALDGSEPGRLAEDPAVARCALAPATGRQRRHERGGSAAGRSSRRRAAVRLAVDTGADRRAGRRVSRCRREPALCARPPGVDGSAAQGGGRPTVGPLPQLRVSAVRRRTGRASSW